MFNSPAPSDCSQSTYCPEIELLPREILQNASWQLKLKHQAVRDIIVHYDKSKEKEAHVLLKKLQNSSSTCANSQLAEQELITHLETTISDFEGSGNAATGVSQDSGKVPSLWAQNHDSQPERKKQAVHNVNTRYTKCKQKKVRTISQLETIIVDTENELVGDTATGLSQCLNFQPNMEIVHDIKVTELEEALCILTIDGTGNVVVESASPVIKKTEPYDCKEDPDVKTLYADEESSRENIPTQTSNKRKFEYLECEQKYVEKKPEIKPAISDALLTVYKKLEESVKIMEEDRSKFIERLQARKGEILRERAKKQARAVKGVITDLTVTQDELDRNRRMLREIRAKFRKMYLEKKIQTFLED